MPKSNILLPDVYGSTLRADAGQSGSRLGGSRLGLIGAAVLRWAEVNDGDSCWRAGCCGCYRPCPCRLVAVDVSGVAAGLGACEPVCGAARWDLAPGCRNGPGE